jgi:hypothetical protein
MFSDALIIHYYPRLGIHNLPSFLDGVKLLHICMQGLFIEQATFNTNFGIFMVVINHIVIFCALTSCSLVGGYWRFRRFPPPPI